jgi:hypothetical protein
MPPRLPRVVALPLEARPEDNGAEHVAAREVCRCRSGRQAAYLPGASGHACLSPLLPAVSPEPARSQGACAFLLNGIRLEQVGLDGDVALGCAPGCFHQGRETAELGHVVRGADEAEVHLRGDLDVGVGPVAICRVFDGEMRQ